MDKIVIIVGHQASGKTRNAQALKDHYGAKRVVDDWGYRFQKLELGDLALYTGDDIRALHLDRRFKKALPHDTPIEMMTIDRALEKIND